MSKIVHFFADNYIIFAVASSMASIVLFLFHLNPIAQLILAAIFTIIFFLSKDAVEEKRSKQYFIVARIVVIIIAVEAAIGLLWKVGNIFGGMPAQFYLIVGLGGIVTLSLLLFTDNGKKQEAIDKIKITNIRKEEKYGQGASIRLCKDKDTNEDIVINYIDRFLHMLVIGPTGCGKTSQVLTPMLWQDIQNMDCGVTVLEPKGDLAEKVYAMCKKTKRPCLYFNPINPDCPKFNPFDGKEDDIIENMTTTFNMLSPDSGTYFKDMTDNLLRKSLMVLKRLELAYMDPDTKISERPATMVTLSTLIHNPAGKGQAMIKEFQKIKCGHVEKKQNDDTAAWFMDEYYPPKSKIYENTSGVRAQVSKIISNRYLRQVLNPENGKSDVNFDEILANGGVLAISTAQGNLRQLGDYLGYFIILSIQSAVFKRPGTEFTRRPHYLYIDEFQKYSNPGFQDMLTQGRSFRVASHLATQARCEIAMGGGRDGKNFVELVSANARNVVLFPGISPADAEYYSKEFGEETVVQLQTGVTKQKFNPLYGIKEMNYPTEQVRQTETQQAKYSMTDLIYKPFGEITYKIIKQSSVQTPKNGVVTWLPKDLNDELDDIALQYQQEQRVKAEKIEQEEYQAAIRNSSRNREKKSQSKEMDFESDF